MIRIKSKLKSELSEALLRIDELEAKLDFLVKERASDKKQIEVQKNVIIELRQFRDNSVELSEYKSLRSELDVSLDKLTESQLKVDSLHKRLATEQNEIELLHHKNQLIVDENQELKNKLNESLVKVNEQKKIIIEKNNLEAERDYYQKQFENTLTENLELQQLLEVYKNEDSNEDNISVDNLNQSMSKFLESLDCNANEELCDSVLDIKLLDIEKALEEKRKLNEDLKNKSKLMNEEIRKLMNLRLEFETKVFYLKNDLNPKNLKDKQNFDKVFDLVEQKVLSYIPLNNYLTPIGRKLMYALTPRIVTRVFGLFNRFY